MEIKKIAVLGAGVMGCDVALDLAIHDYEVLLQDISRAQLDSAKNKIEQQFRFFKMMNPETAKKTDEILNCITLTEKLDAIDGFDFIVENIVENWEEKRKLYFRLNDFIDDRAIIAVNTSCVPISKIASLLKHPQNIIGTHFMNPVPFKKFVEVIKGKETSEETVSTTIAFLKTLGKRTVVVNDSPGFVSNRVLMLTINESIRTVEEGIAKPVDVDKIFKLGFSHAMGPLATADLIGLDTIMYSLNVLCDEFKDTKYKPCNLLVEMVNNGQLGKKSGKGFFNY
jgi:3-hydroxybutyryl-CoA dehydrogenase